MKKISKKIFISLFAVIFSFAFIFAFVAVNFSDNKTVVKADEVTSSTFTTSSNFVFVSRSSNYYEWTTMCFYFRFGLTYNSSTGVYSCVPVQRYAYYLDLYEDDYGSSLMNFYVTGNSWSNNGFNMNTNTTYQCGFKSYSSTDYNLTNSYRVNLRVSAGFNVNDVKRVWSGSESSDRELWWEYYDSAGNSFSIIWIGVPTDICNNYTDRMYYLSDDINISNDAIYQSGYSAGFNSGYESGADDGYDTGYSNGYTAGDSAGFNRGVISANDYSFIGLIGATIDAPIKALTGLLNFEILGVNLSAFVYGLFSITLVIIVIKYIKGGDR